MEHYAVRSVQPWDPTAVENRAKSSVCDSNRGAAAAGGICEIKASPWFVSMFLHAFSSSWNRETHSSSHLLIKSCHSVSEWRFVHTALQWPHNLIVAGQVVCNTSETLLEGLWSTIYIEHKTVGISHTVTEWCVSTKYKTQQHFTNLNQIRQREMDSSAWNVWTCTVHCSFIFRIWNI